MQNERVPLPRPAAPTDVPTLREIEISAGDAFRDIDMAAIAHDDPPTPESYLEAVELRHLWVIDDDDSTPVAYLWAFELDGGLHIEQVSVAATHARRGLGRALIEHAAGLARERGAPCLTLTTFAQVPWNAPYYERIGFRTLDENELSPGLRAIRDAEAAHGLGEWPRVCMRLDL